MLNFKRIPNCNDVKNKEEMLELAVVLVKYAKISRQQGILSLKHCLDDEIVKENIFLNLMLHFITEGIDMGSLEQYGKNYIQSSCQSDDERLKYMLITEGMVDIMAGLTEVFLAEILGSYLGIEMREEFRLALQENDVAKIPGLK